MTTGWGIDPLKDGNGAVTIGTTAEDFRKIQGALYSPGIINGGLVTRSSSAMTYTIATGVAAFPITTGTGAQTALGPIPAGTLPTTAPASGTRVDMIYAQQRTVTDNGDPNIVLGIGTTLPPRSVLLDAYIVSSTNTNTNATVKQAIDIKYSIPYGSSMGIWFQHRSTYNGTFNATPLAAASGSFYLPADRRCSFKLTTSLNSSGAVGFDNSKYCEAAYAMYIDGIWRWTWTTGGLHQAMQDYNWEEYFNLTQGNHTIRVDRWRSAGPGTPYQRYGQGNQGLLCLVLDVGPVS